RTLESLETSPALKGKLSYSLNRSLLRSISLPRLRSQPIQTCSRGLYTRCRCNMRNELLCLSEYFSLRSEIRSAQTLTRGSSSCAGTGESGRSVRSEEHTS